jgi:hypothetical protein
LSIALNETVPRWWTPHAESKSSPMTDEAICLI